MKTVKEQMNYLSSFANEAELSNHLSLEGLTLLQARVIDTEYEKLLEKYVEAAESEKKMYLLALAKMRCKVAEAHRVYLDTIDLRD